MRVVVLCFRAIRTNSSSEVRVTRWLNVHSGGKMVPGSDTSARSSQVHCTDQEDEIVFDGASAVLLMGVDERKRLIERSRICRASVLSHSASSLVQPAIMQQASFLLLLLSVITSTRRQPSCPNSQQPKLDMFGRPIQCLPGSSSRAICGTNYTCFFSGINYMCCPSNDPSIDIQPTCPTPALTVLDSYGIPLKCNPRTRSCLKKSMVCTAVGLTYICCERISGVGQADNVESKSHKRISQRRNFHTTIAYEEAALDCPQKSNSLIKSDGSRTLCNTSTECPGKDAFCYGTFARSICCEWYAIPDHGAGEDLLGTVDSSAKLQKMLKTSPHSTDEGMESSVRVKSNGRDYQKRKMNRVFSSASVTPLPEIEKSGRLNSTELNSSNLSTLSGYNITRAVNSGKTSSTVNRMAFASLIDKRQSANQRIDLSSATLPSQLFSKEDKRTMAQQFLMHHIRNGWPYADRFYRPDMDAFSSEQRRDVARIQFSDN